MELDLKEKGRRPDEAWATASRRMPRRVARGAVAEAVVDADAAAAVAVVAGAAGAVVAVAVGAAAAVVAAVGEPVRAGEATRTPHPQTLPRVTTIARTEV
jgi:hypothetical protein